MVYTSVNEIPDYDHRGILTGGGNSKVYVDLI